MKGKRTKLTTTIREDLLKNLKMEAGKKGLKISEILDGLIESYLEEILQEESFEYLREH